MSALSIGLAMAIRVVLVLLFLPFSALDKVLDFRSAVAQAEEALPNKVGATGLILVGLFVEVFMSAGVVSGVADRACAFVLAGYCAVTALVWKQFWRSGDFWSSSGTRIASEGRDVPDGRCALSGGARWICWHVMSPACAAGARPYQQENRQCRSILFRGSGAI